MQRAQKHIIVVGAGAAGLSAALAAARKGAAVSVLYPGEHIALSPGSTQLAQGGIAAAIHPLDSYTSHLKDTINAGAGLVDAAAARTLVEDGARIITALLDAGFPADRTAAGEIDFALEAAHARARVLHAGGDRSGAKLHKFLIEAVHQEPRIEHIPGQQLREIIVRDGLVQGVRANSVITADAVILASGGYGAVYPRATGAPQAQGHAMIAAARAGALLADVEFVQFHPTVLEGTRHLISEAVRGAGAHLIDDFGRRFMFDIDPRGELAPRDVVAAGIARVTGEGTGHVWLDARHLSGLDKEFPGISASLKQAGFNWHEDPIPVSPAAHYCMGGIATDVHARTSLPGLFAVGEAARTGVHGANRLASNSLLEALVFGSAAGCAALDEPQAFQPTNVLYRLDVTLPPQSYNANDTLARSAIAAGLGIERDAEHIATTRETLSSIGGSVAATGTLIAAAAEARTESRGAHQRRDFPDTDPAQARPIVLNVKGTHAH